MQAETLEISRSFLESEKNKVLLGMYIIYIPCTLYIYHVHYIHTMYIIYIPCTLYIYIIHACHRL